MGILVGVHPGGKSKFAVSAVYWNGKLPVALFHARSYSGVDEVLSDIIGLVGEWGGLDGVAIDGPLTWSGNPSGWRSSDLALRKSMPPWLPKSWVKPPNTLPGAISVQGPALTWALAREVRQGMLPEHPLFETHPRLTLAAIARDLREPVLNYRNRLLSAQRREQHIARLVERLVETGIVRIEAEAPKTADELDALVCSVVALAKIAPATGLITREWVGGDIRPVGKRSIVLLTALP